MSRRKGNSSFFDKQTKCIRWRVQWRFLSPLTRLADAEAAAGESAPGVQQPTRCVSQHDEALSEDVRLDDALDRFLGKRPETASLRHRLPVHCEQRGQLVLLMRQPDSPANRAAYYRLGREQTLREALRGKVLIEFPVIHVLPPALLPLFSVLPQQQQMPLPPPPPPRPPHGSAAVKAEPAPARGGRGAQREPGGGAAAAGAAVKTEPGPSPQHETPVKMEVRLKTDVKTEPVHAACTGAQRIVARGLPPSGSGGVGASAAASAPPGAAIPLID